MQLITKSLFLYFLLTHVCFAYCDFSNLKFGFKHPGGFNTPDGHHFEKIYGEHVCFDKAYHNITFQGEFLDGKLISANLRQSNISFNFLENIIHFYGEPSHKNTSTDAEGIDYYYWNLFDKQIVLKNHKSPEGTATNLVMTPNNYLKILEQGKID